MKKTALIAGFASLLSFAPAVVLPLQADAPAAASAAALEKGTMRVTIGDEVTVAKLDPHSSDWTDAGSMSSASLLSMIRKDTLKSSEGSVMLVGISFDVANGQGSNGEIQMTHFDKKGHYLSRGKLSEPKLTFTKAEKKGDKLDVEGTIEAKTFLRDGGKIDESKSIDVKVEFSAELAPPQ